MEIRQINVSLMLRPTRQRVPEVSFHAHLAEEGWGGRGGGRSSVVVKERTYLTHLARACREVIPSTAVGGLKCAGDIARFLALPYIHGVAAVNSNPVQFREITDPILLFADRTTAAP